MKNIRYILALLTMIFLCVGCSNPALPVKPGTDVVQESPTEDAEPEFVVHELDSVFIKDSDTQQDDEDVLYLTMATTGNWEELLRGDLMEEYSKKLYEWSDGKMILTTLYNGVLGNDLELVRAVQEGTISIVNSVPSYQSGIVPEAALLDVPGLFESVEEYNTFMKENYLVFMQRRYKKKGIHLISSTAYTFRVLTSNREIQSLDDIRGLKIRTMENKYQMEFWQNMGAIVSPLYWAQVRTAIQQGMVEAQENPVGYMKSSDLADVQDYVCMTNHMPMISNVIINEEQFQSMTKEQQELLTRMFQEMDAELARRQPEEDQQLIEELKVNGCVVSEPGEDIQEAIREAGKSVLDTLREDLGNSVVDEFLFRLGRSDLIHR